MTSMIEELAAHPELIFRHTVEDYHEMISNGTIVEGDPFELLDGQIVRKIRSASGEDFTSIGKEHAYVVGRIARLSAAFEPLNCHVRSQQPITLPPSDEPEPDATIVRGSLEDYLEHHPFAEDILCAIEVADSSLPRDRGYKLRLYAGAGIAMYVIVNLIDRVIEVYQNPLTAEKRFAESSKRAAGESVEFPTAAGEKIVLPVEELLPE